jgi:hypothetical protein
MSGIEKRGWEDELNAAWAEVNKARRQRDEAGGALRAIATYAAPPHPEPCGTDACLLCLIHGTAQAHAGERTA